MSTRPGLSRRAFLSRAAVIGGAGALSGVLDLPAAHAVATATAWRLSCDWGYPRGHRGATACGCNACVAHSRNKLFATLADAEAMRAHPGCLCVATPIEIAQPAYDTLFAHARAADRRDPHTAAVLDGAPPTTVVAPVEPTPTPTPGTTATTAPDRPMPTRPRSTRPTSPKPGAPRRPSPRPGSPVSSPPPTRIGEDGGSGVLGIASGRNPGGPSGSTAGSITGTATQPGGAPGGPGTKRSATGQHRAVRTPSAAAGARGTDLRHAPPLSEPTTFGLIGAVAVLLAGGLVALRRRDPESGHADVPPAD